MLEADDQRTSSLAAVSDALGKLHKEQFGRGPIRARSYFAGPDVVVCVLEDVLLPAERRMVEIGQLDRVRDTRASFQEATAADFVGAVERILARTVRSFASGLDVAADVAYENFYLEPRGT
jgi:uncharacterized protein YbcI